MSFDLDELQAGGVSLNELFRRYFAAQGIDLGQAVRDREYARQDASRAARARAEELRDIARQLRRARRALAAEQAGWRSGWTGFTADEVAYLQSQVSALDAELREAAGWNEALIRDVKRSIAD